MRNLVAVFFMLSVLFLVGTVPAYAAFTLPSLPVTDLETAGTAVAALVASWVLIRLAIRMIKSV